MALREVAGTHQVGVFRRGQRNRHSVTSERVEGWDRGRGRGQGCHRLRGGGRGRGGRHGAGTGHLAGAPEVLGEITRDSRAGNLHTETLTRVEEGRLGGFEDLRRLFLGLLPILRFGILVPLPEENGRGGAAQHGWRGGGREGKGREGKGGIFKLPSKQAGTTTFWIKTMTVMCLMDAFVGTIRPQRVRDEVRKSQNTSERSPFRVYACYDPYWARIISRYLFFGETFVSSLRTFNLKNLETSFPGSPHH